MSLPRCPNNEDIADDPCGGKPFVTDVAFREEKTILSLSLTCHDCGHEYGYYKSADPKKVEARA